MIRNKSNIHMNSQGKMVDKYGRILETDWDEFTKQRNKVTVPILAIIKSKKL